MVLIKNILIYQYKKESQYILSSTIMEPIWRKQSMILTQNQTKKKSITTTDKDVFGVSLNLKHPYIMACILYFIQIYLIFLEIRK